jgi:predicted nuclease of predicted toxin-antitoxin system
MKLLLDMNLSPAWVPLLVSAGWEAVHWSSVGAATATDAEIMAWAKLNAFTVITNDLDHSAILASTRAQGPSVVQLRAQDLSPGALGPTLLTVLNTRAEVLESGAVLTLDLRTARVRTLPLS